MSLLELEHVSKRHRRGTHDVDALRDVSLHLDAGELVAIWGLRRSGRSTLLRLAAGIETPDTGVVRFARRDLTTNGAIALENGIAYCHRGFPVSEGQIVLDEMIAGSLARGKTPSKAKKLAEEALGRAGARQCARLEPHELDDAEAVRVMIGRALVNQPSLLLVDEPTKGVDLLDRDEILALLRSLAHEGLAVLTSVGETTALFGADRALSLSDGEIRGDLSPELAPVVRLPRRAVA